jgi:group I intron endonuclease
MKDYFIYTYENKLNGKVYVGKSGDIEERIKEHLYYAKVKEKAANHYQALHKAMNKYGVENFEFNIVQYCEDNKDASQWEIYWIAYLKEQGVKLYNISSGGEGSPRPHSEETKKKISKALKGKFDGENNPFFGKQHTEETKKIIGKKSSQRNKGAGNYWFGKTLPEHVKNLMSERHKGNTYSLGKKHSKEAKQKMSIATLNRRPLDKETILSIRKMIAEGKSNASIAKMYNVDPSVISKIKTRKTYSDIE